MTQTDYLSDQAINNFIELAIAEDVGSGDQSSLASIPEDTPAKATLNIKEDCVIAGVSLAQKIFRNLDPSIEFINNVEDGSYVHSGAVGFIVKGNARSILAAERFVLNCMQRMSGIATKTQRMVALIKGSKAKLIDTRKTTPNFRLAEKWAVKIGGGYNHRFGLFDMIMLKDNHIDYAGGIKKVITATQEHLASTGQELKIEIETRNITEVMEVLEVGGVDVILLDNMIPSDMREAVKIIDGSIITEASGGITELNIQDVAECGVDFISVGALTHSFKSIDMSLKAVVL